MSAAPDQIVNFLPLPAEWLLSCLADIHKVEILIGKQFTPGMRFCLVKERLAQRPDNN